MAQKGWELVKNVPVEAMHLSSIGSASSGNDTTFNVRVINNHAFLLECRFYCAQILNNMYLHYNYGTSRVPSVTTSSLSRQT